MKDIWKINLAQKEFAWKEPCIAPKVHRLFAGVLNLQHLRINIVIIAIMVLVTV